MTEIDGFLPDDSFFVDADDIVDDSPVIDGVIPDDSFFVDAHKPHSHKHSPKHHHHHEKYTYFDDMYNFFLSGITDDMFMELTPEDTHEILEELLFAALPYFEFCRHDLFDMDLCEERFNWRLSVEEMMIVRQYMIAQWIGYQLATIDLIKQKYSGSDFKFTSQASHIKQLQAMKIEYERQGFHLQRLYKRRTKKKDGRIGSTLAMIMETPQE